MNGLKKVYHDNNNSDENETDSILNGSKQKKRLDCNSWRTKPTFDKEEDEDDDDDDDDHEEDHEDVNEKDN